MLSEEKFYEKKMFDGFYNIHFEFKNGSIEINGSTLKIRNLADRHSFPRWAITKDGHKLATLSGGGSYGWIIGETDDSTFTRGFLNMIIKVAQKSHLGWAWNNVQTW